MWGTNYESTWESAFNHHGDNDAIIIVCLLEWLQAKHNRQADQG